MSLQKRAGYHLTVKAENNINDLLTNLICCCQVLVYHNSIGLRVFDLLCRYLSPVGPKGTLQGRKDSAGKDEQFTLIDSHPQVTLFSKTKEKYVSGKQGLCGVLWEI